VQEKYGTRNPGAAATMTPSTAPGLKDGYFEQY
jgi:hypothetical protein